MRALLVAGLAIGITVAGCAPQGDEDPVPSPTATRTVFMKSAVALPKLPHASAAWPAPEVTAEGSVIRVGTRSYDVAPLRADSVVSTRGGVYFLSAGELWYLDEHGAVGTGYAHLTRIVASDDGRYLGLVDRNHGPVGLERVQVAAAVVYDTTTGKTLVHSRAGMRGDDTADDGSLREEYRSDPPGAIGFEDGALIASTPAGVYAYPLSGEAPHPRS